MVQPEPGQNVTVTDQHGKQFVGYLCEVSNPEEIIDTLREMWTGATEYYGVIKFVCINDPGAREAAEKMVGPITATNRAPKKYDRPNLHPRTSRKGDAIRCYTPSQLTDDMEDRDDVEDYQVYVHTSGSSREVTIVHTLTGLRASCRDYPGVFRNRREAWAQLQDKIEHRHRRTP